MLSGIRRFFAQHIAEAVDGGPEVDQKRAYQLATAALLIEMTRADYEVKAVERTAVAGAIQRAFELTAEQTDELIGFAEQQADQATSLYEFTRLINDHFNDRQKAHVVELLWYVAYADAELDKYEEHLVRKIADLLYVPHHVFIRAKLQAKERMAGQTPKC